MSENAGAILARWELGALMLCAIDQSRANALQGLAEAAARSFDAACDAEELSPLIAAASQIFVPETAPALRAGPVRTALLCTATIGLIAELTAELASPAQARRQALATLGRALRDTAAGQDWDAVADGSEGAYWRAVAGKLEAGGAAAAALGALLAGAPADALPAVRALGRALGRIGQIQDDVLDVTAEPPAADWRRPECNIVLLYGIAPGMPNREEMAHAIASAATAEGRQAVRTRLSQAGAGVYLRHVAGHGLAEAQAALAAAAPPNPRPLADALAAFRADVAALIGALVAPDGSPALRAEPDLPWPLLDEIAPQIAKAASGTIASWARHACLAVGGTGEQAAPAIAILARLVATVRVLDDWQDGDPGIHERIGGGRTANLAVGIAATALERAAELPLEGEAWQIAVRSIGRGLALTLRGQDLDLTAPLDEAGYWQVVDSKTPPLIETALTLGALLGGATVEQAGRLSALSGPLGRVLQIGDDIHDALDQPSSADWRRPERNLLLLYACTSLGERFRSLAAADPAAARALLVPGALAYAAHAVLATADEVERTVGRLRLAHPQALFEPVGRFRDWSAELLKQTGLAPVLRRAAG
jgi:geranylgeranyl pyrophosphate synthase